MVEKKTSKTTKATKAVKVVEVKKEKNIVEKLQYIQTNLKAPKGQMNKFGNYKYRSTEDIMEAVKPLLSEMGCIITLGDELVLIGDRYYIKATAKITDGIGILSEPGFAREAQNKKGMDESQITGATSSYARKYALNGLLAIDDTKDADSFNKHENETPKTTPKTTPKAPVAAPKSTLSDDDRYKEGKSFAENAITDLIKESMDKKYDITAKHIKDIGRKLMDKWACEVTDPVYVKVRDEILKPQIDSLN